MLKVKMNREAQVLAVVQEFVEDRGIDSRKIVLDANLAELGVDSMHAVDLVFRFEEAFGVTIPMEEFQATTVGEAVAFVVRLIPMAPTPK